LKRPNIYFTPVLIQQRVVIQSKNIYIYVVEKNAIVERQFCDGSGGINEEFEDTKGVIRIRKLKKNRVHNGQKKKGLKDKQRST